MEHQLQNNLLIFVAVLGAAYLVCLFVGTIIFRAACSLFNKLAGADKRIPDPSFGKALGIMFVTIIVNGIFGAGAGFVLGAGSVVAGADAKTVQLLSSLVSMPIGLLGLAVMAKFLLPTTFGRALLVGVLFYVIAMVIGLAVVLGGVLVWQLV